MTPTARSNASRQQQPSASASAPNPLVMGEILPGLWIGNLHSLRELQLFQQHRQQQQQRGGGAEAMRIAWTVITLLESERLIRWATAVLHKAPAVAVERHVVWKLADHAQADFLSLQLEQVLQAMDHAMVMNTATITTTDSSLAAALQPQVPQQQQQQLLPQLRRACLVHCACGVSRSAAVCAAWLLSSRHATSVSQALHTIRRVRPQIHPNLGFLAALRALEQCHGNVPAARERWRKQDAANSRITLELPNLTRDSADAPSHAEEATTTSNTSTENDAKE